MGEKSGGLTNIVISIIAFVAIALVVQGAFPNLVQNITDGLSAKVSGTLGTYTPDVNIGN